MAHIRQANKLRAQSATMAGGNVGVSLIWSTDYDLGSDWVATDGVSTGIAGLTRYLGSSTSSGSHEQIITAASRSGSTGVRGQRHWLGDGTNNNSGGTVIALGANYTELWIRWYMRYQSGFQWNTLSYHKWLLITDGTGAALAIPEWSDPDRVNIFANGSNNRSSIGNGWAATMGGTTSDGAWHLYECHVKLSTGGGSNGEGRIWIDGNLKMESTSIAYGATSETNQWSRVVVGSNSSTPNNGSDYYVDFDDIAISNEGRIGAA